MTLLEIQRKYYPTVAFEIKGMRVVALCQCDAQKRPHRRVFEFDKINPSVLDVVDADISVHLRLTP